MRQEFLTPRRKVTKTQEEAGFSLRPLRLWVFALISFRFCKSMTIETFQHARIQP